ncbi:MAG: imelysin family protein [Bacteroidota bacterium]
MKKSIKLFFFSFLCFTFSCSDDEDNSGNLGFDRANMLQSVAEDLIIPNFETLQNSVSNLQSSVNEFVTTTNEANLGSLRQAWVTAVTDHQHCSAFGFGPGSLSLGSYASVLGVFPVSESKIETAIGNPNFNLAGSFDRDLRGFYTVEYLIYGNGQTDAELVAGFDQARKDYLSLITNELKTTFDDIVTEWNTSYQDQFVASDGTADGSSISLYYNEFVKDYENLKNFKLELPAGLSAGQTSSDGTLVEAFYSGISRDLIVEHFESSKNIYLGLARNGDVSVGFDEYLNSVEGGPELVESTLGMIDQIDQAIGNLPQGRLSDQVDAPEVTTLRNLLQDNTANFKSSIVSLLGISITFNSGDGD